jgi:uncharacterized protein DUF4255
VRVTAASHNRAVASFQSVSAAGTSIEQLLNSCFATAPPGVFTRPPKAVLARTEDFDSAKATGLIKPGVLSIFFYRVESNKTMRAAWSSVGSFDGFSHLPLDLHFLITAWADNPETELLMIGLAMQCLETNPILGGPLLAPAGAWTANEAMQVVLEDVPPDSMFRIFDSLQADFKLSVAYLARVVRIDGVVSNLAPEVTTVVAGSVPSVRP